MNIFKPLGGILCQFLEAVCHVSLGFKLGFVLVGGLEGLFPLITKYFFNFVEFF